ncbi:ABC transporter ATP-binding protein [Allohahella sp. A8]|uniref:ABC transporter ATP-binding protein n=1 Tax=Allohahella sp. A8 TaxID=3141461 RepID=UPI000C0B3B3C|nr:multidrug ABC transporter ATP-binding protein [Hahellaceae bacterium]|tara:strand:+ start:10214 stop:12016 length:1803 start_codon:yes stop_codon:yes gene_type:complete
MYILNVIKTILSVLDSKMQRNCIALQFVFLVAAFFEVIGIASIGPFIAILSNPDIIRSNDILSAIYVQLGFESDLQFIMAAALGSLIMILLSNAVAAITMWLTFRFSVALGSSLQQKIYRNFLHKDYLFHKTGNYNKRIAVVSSQVPRFVYMLFQPFLVLTSQLFIATIILVGLLILNPLLALVAGSIIGGSYLLTYIFIRKKLAYHGEIISERNTQVQSILSESFIGIKDVKLDAIENRYIERYNSVNVRGLKSQSFIALSGSLPRFIIESISFGAILVLALVLLTTQDDIRSVVPILSIYALAGYKLLPTMQQIYKSVSSLSGHGSVAGIVKSSLDAAPAEPPAHARQLKPIRIDEVKLSNANFIYNAESAPAINNVSLTLRRGEIYSLVGHSGSGKSTLADVILGLLKPHSGELLVNGTPLRSEDLVSFRKRVGYVAQTIFILDDNVVNNVAFGVPENEIDMERVKQALTLANADEFVESLPKGIYSDLGQDGKLLSGGQRQRIGIARALYKQTDLLVLDEPTSALDMESEHKLMMTLHSLKKDLIILVISHRPASIKMSDQIILMAAGELEDVGPYKELVERNDHFRDMMARSTTE